MNEEFNSLIMAYFIIVFFIFAVVFFWHRREQKKEFVVEVCKWQAMLDQHVAFYKVLNEEERKVFSKRVAEFIETYPILGFDTEVVDLDRLYVAASAIIPTLGFESWSYRGLEAIYLIDGALPHEDKNSLVSGQVSSEGTRCKMALSRQALYTGFENVNDKRNVGVHEFVHVLDHLDGEIDGIPSLCMDEEIKSAWVELVKNEMLKIRKNRSSIDAYGGTHEVEFFAVVSEYFFENPKRLKKEHPEVYDLMSKSFRQNLWERFKDFVSKPKAQNRPGRNSPCPCGSGKKYKKCCMRK